MVRLPGTAALPAVTWFKASLTLCLTFTAATGCVNLSAYSNADLSGSIITVSTPNVPANGVDNAEVRVLVRRKDGQGIPGVAVQVVGDQCDVEQPIHSTDANGMAMATVRSANVGRRTISAQVQWRDFDNVLPVKALINFFQVTSDGNTSQAGAPVTVNPIAQDPNGGC